MTDIYSQKVELPVVNVIVDGLWEEKYGPYTADEVTKLIQEHMAKALEAAAHLIEPVSKRPCNCEICECGNRGDAEAVAMWDESNANARTIRNLIGRV